MSANRSTVTQDIRDLGLAMSAPVSLKVERKSAVYTPEELRFFSSDLISKEGYSLVAACKAAGLASSMSMQVAKNEKGDRGIGTIRRILESIGYRTTLLVHVTRIDSDQKRESKDPDLMSRVRRRKNMRKRRLKRKYGPNAALAEILVIDDGVSVLGNKLIEARLQEFDQQDAISDITNNE